MKNNIFPKFTITPINSIQEALNKGGFDQGHMEEYQKEDYEHLKTIKLSHESFQKDVCLFYLPSKDVCAQNMQEVVGYMKEYGLKPCNYASNYLLGFMSQVSESQWPQEIEDMIGDRVSTIVAFDPHNPWSTFRALTTCEPSFLKVIRYRKVGDTRKRMLASQTCGSCRWFYKPESLGIQFMLAEKI